MSSSLADDASTSSSTTCRPRLFVYDLPPRYRYEGRAEGQGFPPPLNLTEPLRGFPPSVELRAADTYVAGGIFLARALAYRCRTLNPSKADLFFIPAFTDHIGGRPGAICADASLNTNTGKMTNCSRDRLFERLEAAAPGALHARGGSDHIVLQPRHGYAFDLVPTAEFRYTDKRLGHAIRFSMEEGNVEYEWPGSRTKTFFHSTPFTSFVNAEPATPWGSLPWRAQPRRDVLVGVAFNAIHKMGPAVGQMNALRDRLLSSCKAAADPSLCTVLPLSPTNLQIRGYHMRLLERIVALYWRSTFCLQPIGDACTRKATIDSLLLGCIPVVFHKCQTLQWPWHWGQWLREATVYIDIRNVTTGSKASVDVVQYLRSIPAAKVARMQHAIATHAHCLHYRMPESGASSSDSMVGAANDAFDITLKGSWLIAKQQQQTQDTVALNAQLERLCRPAPLRIVYDKADKNPQTPGAQNDASSDASQL